MSADNFAACLAVTLAYEGGKADNPKDPGGRTNKGVTQRTYDGFRRGRGEPTRDVYGIDDTEVSNIYRNLYWTKAGCDALPAGLDLSHFDASVNSGLGNSAKWLAKARLKTTVAAQIQAYGDWRLSFLKALKNWATFGKGWSVRVAGVEAKAFAMALGSGPAAQTVIGKAASSASKKATIASTVSTAAKAATGASGLAVVTTTHPAAAASLGVTSIVVAIWSGFLSWRSGLRAAALTHAAT